MSDYSGQFVRSRAPQPVALLRVYGEDAASYLQSQVSADLRDCRDGQSSYALWLDARGYVQADSLIYRQNAESFLIFSGNTPQARLRDIVEANIIADDVEIDPLGESYTRWALWRQTACGSANVAADAHAASSRVATANSGTELADAQGAGTEPATVFAVADLAAQAASVDATAAHALLFAGRNSARENYDFLLPAGTPLPASVEALPELGWAWRQAQRISDGIAEIPTDIGVADFPQDGGDLPRVAVSTSKGCYLGQEMVARWHATGQVRSGLFRVELLPALSIEDAELAGALPAEALQSWHSGAAASPLRLYVGTKPVGELRSFAPCCGRGLALLRIHRLGDERLLSLAAEGEAALRVLEPMLS